MEEASCAVIEPLTTCEHSESQDKVESDETFDNPCQPCLSEDKQVESRKYCEDCQELLCDACIEFHKKVTLTKKHKLVNKDQANTDTKPTSKSLPICFNHVGKIVDLFCEDHKKLICQLCGSIRHSQCKHIVSIKEAALNVKESEEFERTTSEINDTRNKFEDYISKRENDSTRVEAELKTALEILMKGNAKLIQIIEKLKSFDETKIKQKYSVISNSVENDIKQCKSIVADLKNAKEFLENTNEDEICVFTQIKAFQRNVKNAKTILSAKQEITETETIVYETNDEVSNKLNIFKGLGNLVREKHTYSKSSLKSSDSIQTNNTGVSRDQNHGISAMCILEDDYIAVTEWEMKCLKLINTTDKTVTKSLTFDSFPFDVCKLPNKILAVTFLHGHQIKLVSYDFPLTLKTVSGFDTVEKCRGIVYFEDLLYVACGGGGMQNEGPGHIRVYNIKGKHEKTILKSTSGEVIINKPWKISVSRFNELYITDSNKGLLKINDNSIEETEYTTGCNSAAFDEHGHIFVSSTDMNSIIQLENDGTIVADVLSEEDGIKNPHALAFDCEKNILYVTMKKSSEIQMYFLDYK